MMKRKIYSCAQKLALLMLFNGLHVCANQSPALEHFNQARLYHEKEQISPAITEYQRAIALDATLFEAHFHLGNLYYNLSNHKNAIEHYQKTLSLNPNCLQAYYNLGMCFAVTNNFQAALEPLLQAVALQPNYTKAFKILGTIYDKLNQLDKARECYAKALALEPTNTKIMLARARTLRNHQFFDDAMQDYNVILGHEPQNTEVIFELGLLYAMRQNFVEAEHLFHQILTISPQYQNIDQNLAYVYRKQGKMDQSIQAYEKALKVHPTNHHIRYGLAEAYLTIGDFEQGFELYESRWKRLPDTRNFSTRLWDGSDLTGKTILLRAEYGFGDTIEFIRYAAELKKMGSPRIILEAQAPLISLLSRCPYLDQVIALGSELPAFDFQVPLMSLPAMCKTSLATIPATVPYLKTEQALEHHWAQKFAHDTNFKIGICWQSGPYYDSFTSPLSKKNMQLEHFFPLTKIPGVSVYSLQKMSKHLNSLPHGILIHELGDDVDESNGRFMDTAAVMKQLQLIITVDTATAHLAGALGVPVWVTLPLVPDWRWMQERSDSPWYPSMRLFRQHKAGDWESVIEQILAALQTLVPTTNIKKAAAPLAGLVTAEIAIGELIDKITILEIKMREVKNQAKLKNIKTELEALKETYHHFVSPTQEIEELSKQLLDVNKKLWDIEDLIREKESKQHFDQEFIELARGVYFTNDQRCAIKRKLNDLVGSRIVEEKSYTQYSINAPKL